MTCLDHEEVVRLFLNALFDRNVATEVLKRARGLPNTLDEAIRLAEDELSVADYLTPSPAVNTATAKVSALHEDAITELKKEIRSLREGLVAATSVSTNCFRCQSGHYARECKTKGPPKLVCRRCRRSGHIAPDCSSPPPKRPCPQCGEGHWLFDCPREGIRF
jgi:hypothetical protein